MEPRSQSFFPDPETLWVENFRFLTNGPYSFSLFPDNIVGISGKSGVGKSQLLRAIADLHPWTGELQYGKLPCHSVDATVWRKNICYIPAESAWWYDRVEHHFQDSMELSSQELSVLHELGFDQEVLSWRVSRLSSGEKQRLSIFRSLLNGPRVLLLDEPTSNLDQDSIKRVERIILQYQQQTKAAILLVSHDLEQLQRLADIIYVIENDKMTPVSGHVRE